MTSPYSTHTTGAERRRQREQQRLERTALWTPNNQVRQQLQREAELEFQTKRLHRRQSMPTNNKEALEQAKEMRDETEAAAYRIARGIHEIEHVGEMTLEDLYGQRRQLERISNDADAVADDLDNANRMHRKLESWIPIPLSNKVKKAYYHGRNHHHQKTKPSPRHLLDDAKEHSKQTQNRSSQQEGEGKTTRTKLAQHLRSSVQEIKEAARHVGDKVAPHNHDDDLRSNKKRLQRRHSLGQHVRHSVHEIRSTARKVGELVVARDHSGYFHRHGSSAAGTSGEDESDLCNEKSSSSNSLTREEEEQLRSIQRGDQAVDDLFDELVGQVDRVGDMAHEMGQETRWQERRLDSLNQQMGEAMDQQHSLNGRTRQKLGIAAKKNRMANSGHKHHSRRHLLSHLAK